MSTTRAEIAVQLNGHDAMDILNRDIEEMLERHRMVAIYAYGDGIEIRGAYVTDIPHDEDNDTTVVCFTAKGPIVNRCDCEENCPNWEDPDPKHYPHIIVSGDDECGYTIRTDIPHTPFTVKIDADEKDEHGETVYADYGNGVVFSLDQLGAVGAVKAYTYVRVDQPRLEDYAGQIQLNVPDSD